MSNLRYILSLIATVVISTAVFANNPPCEDVVKTNIQSPILSTDSTDIKLSWRIENEIEIDHILLESSTDGVTFVKVATYKLTGNETAFLKYKFQTNRPVKKGFVYYRFKQINKNGKMYCYETMKIELK